MLAEERRERRIERRGDDQRARPAVAQHVVVVGRREQRVRRDRHDAGLDRAQEDRGEVDRVEVTEEHSLLRPQPETVSALAQRFTRSASSPYVYVPESSM